MESYTHAPSVAPSISNPSPTALLNGLGSEILNQPPHSTSVPSDSGAVDSRASPPNTVQAACLACVSLENVGFYDEAIVLTIHLFAKLEGKASKV